MVTTNGHVHAGIVQSVAVVAMVILGLFILRTIVVLAPENPVTDGLAWIIG